MSCKYMNVNRLARQPVVGEVSNDISMGLEHQRTPDSGPIKQNIIYDWHYLHHKRCVAAMTSVAYTDSSKNSSLQLG